MNTNVWDAVILFFYFVFILAAFGGGAYLVDQREWSPWWLLAIAAIVGSIKIKAGHTE